MKCPFESKAIIELGPLVHQLAVDTEDFAGSFQHAKSGSIAFSRVSSLIAAASDEDRLFLSHQVRSDLRPSDLAFEKRWRFFEAPGDGRMMRPLWAQERIS